MLQRYNKFPRYANFLLKKERRVGLLFTEQEHAPVAVSMGGEVGQTLRFGGGDEGGAVRFIKTTEP